MTNPLREVTAVFALTMLAIWFSESVLLLSCLIAIPALCLIAVYWRQNPDNFKNLWKPSGNAYHYMSLYFISLIFWRLILLIGEVRNPHFFSQPQLFWKFAISFILYIGNALWQQVLVNGYLLPRLEEGFQSEKKALLALGFIFGLLHIPNPVLAPVTIVGGMLSAYFFKRTNNIYALVVAHSVLAVSIMYSLPESWHHHLRIGPGYFLWGR